jgi:hypothetical protein
MPSRTKHRRHPRKTEPSPPVSPIAPEQSHGQDFQTETDKNIQADVRVISTPAKDRYDRALFWANIVLTMVGLGGIVVASITLCRIHRQAVEMRLQRILMQRTLGAIRRQANTMDRQAIEAREDSEKSYQLAELNAQRQLRAYLCISKGRLNFTKEGPLEPQLHIVNGGQTPAYEVRTWAKVAVREHPPFHGTPHLAGFTDELQSVGIIPPKGENIMVSQKVPMVVAEKTFLQTRFSSSLCLRRNYIQRCFRARSVYEIPSYFRGSSRMPKEDRQGRGGYGLPFHGFGR